MDAERLKENAAKLRTNDVVLASFPRSGSLWLRSLLYNAWEVSKGGPLPPRGFLSSAFSPTLELPAFTSAEAPREVFRLVKTHQGYGLISASGWRGKTIVLFRRPEDCFASAWTKSVKASKLSHHSPETRKLAQRVGRGVEAYVREHALPCWRDHSLGFLSAFAKRPEALIFVSYERLHERPGETLDGLLEWMGVHLDSARLDSIVENCAFAPVLAKARKISGMASLPLWRGKPGGGKQVLGTDLQAHVEEELGALYRQMQEAMATSWRRERRPSISSQP
ncbi:MAG TPA: sulfotransferase domain-containing protein [Acidobacteriota bacterium]|nr:sulfotransferase domain-containing protein [Acidobacteriota bacterium]